jgi:hypothetical protein
MMMIGGFTWVWTTVLAIQLTFLQHIHNTQNIKTERRNLLSINIITSTDAIVKQSHGVML